MNVTILISADVEWRSILTLHPLVEIQESPMGEWFVDDVEIHNRFQQIRFFHGGWGKIAAAASTQYVIDRWKPELLINLGTCGGFDGAIEKGAIVLVDRTLVYDIVEQMGDHDSAVDFYSTKIDLSWLKNALPSKVITTLMVSGDRDLLVEDSLFLKQYYSARVGDWESGAIAFVANRNRTRLLILRGVTDLVSETGNETYGNFELFEKATQTIMQGLNQAIPGWLEAAGML